MPLSIMKSTTTTTTTILGAILLAGCATKQSSNQDAPTGPLSATFEVTGGSAAYWGMPIGEGTINYQGVAHPFSVDAAEVGVMEGQVVSATGEVYNLHRLSDFAGSYTGVRSGETHLKGAKHAEMTNDKGVVIHVKGSAEGLPSTPGSSTISVKLK